MRRLLLAAMACLMLASCSEKSISDSRFVLGTLCYIELEGTDDSGLYASTMLEAYQEALGSASYGEEASAEITLSRT